MDTTSRFLSDFYDSVHQREYPRLRDAYGERVDWAFVGRMRLDSLLSRTHCMLDTQVLDGEFFLKFGPERLSQVLRRTDLAPMPIEIMSRADSLEQALVGLVRRPGSDRLRSFSFSTLDEETRHELFESLPTQEASRVNTWEDVPRVLSDLGVSPSKVEQLREAWQLWIEGERRGLVRVHRWHGTFDLDTALGSRPSLENNLASAWGRDLLARMWERRSDRSYVQDTLLPQHHRVLETHDGQKKEYRDLRALELWYHRAYNLAAAWQHDCSEFESVRDGEIRGSTSLDLMVGIHLNESGAPISTPEKVLEFDGELLEGLGSIESSRFRHLLAQHRDLTEQWWHDGDPGALKRAIGPFAAEADEYTADSRKRQTLRSEFATASADATGAIVGGLVGSVGGPLGILVGALAGTAGTVVIRHFGVNRVRGRPVRKIVERVTEIAADRRSHGTSFDR